MSRTARTLSLRAAAVILVAACIAIRLAVAALAAPVVDVPRLDCSPVNVSTMPLDDVDAMIRAGWVGDPADGSEALYRPGCAYAATWDPAEIDTWPMGTGLDAATEVAYLVADTASSLSWYAGLLADGWVPAPTEAATDVDGTVHPLCALLVGDTSHVVCADGWSTES